MRLELVAFDDTAIVIFELHILEINIE